MMKRKHKRRTGAVYGSFRDYFATTPSAGGITIVTQMGKPIDHWKRKIYFKSFVKINAAEVISMNLSYQSLVN